MIQRGERMPCKAQSDRLGEYGDAEMWASIYNVLQKSQVQHTKRSRAELDKAEVKHLEHELRRLEHELAAKQRSVKGKAIKSAWEATAIWKAAATQQRLEKERSFELNRQLKLAICERHNYIARLQRTLLRTPRWSVLPDISAAFGGDTRNLPVDPYRRVAAIHRIANYHYKLQQNKFIQAGAYDLREDVFRGDRITLPQGQLGFQEVIRSTLPARFDILAGSIWRVVYGTHRSVSRDEECETWERADVHTVYNRFQKNQNGIVRASNVVWKMFEDVGRVVIVWTTIVEDADEMEDVRGSVDDVNGWCVFAPHPEDMTKSTLTCVRETNVSRLMQQEFVTANADDVIAELKRNCRFLKSSQDENSTCSFLRSYYERNRRFRLPVARAMTHAMEASRKSHSG
ncbi:hypothetical protein AC1031_002140 [Aphanomyces cochlioides]|nr:hypothetical protein AC1031_002140 [Aphanomyces cochlioides]